MRPPAEHVSADEAMKERTFQGKEKSTLRVQIQLFCDSLPPKTDKETRLEEV